MPLQLDFAPLACFVVLMATAAFEDLRRLVIPNAIIVGLCVLWPLHLALAPGTTLVSAITAFGYGLAVFAAGAVLFSRGLIGGGDVKLLAAATLWAGPGSTMQLLFLTGLLGGLLALFALSPPGRQFAALRRGVATTGPSEIAAVPADRVAVPYGVAIASAAVIVTIPPSFS